MARLVSCVVVVALGAVLSSCNAISGSPALGIATCVQQQEQRGSFGVTIVSPSPDETFVGREPVEIVLDIDGPDPRYGDFFLLVDASDQDPLGGGERDVLGEPILWVPNGRTGEVTISARVNEIDVQCEREAEDSVTVFFQQTVEEAALIFLETCEGQCTNLQDGIRAAGEVKLTFGNMAADTGTFPSVRVLSKRRRGRERVGGPVRRHAGH